MAKEENNVQDENLTDKAENSAQGREVTEEKINEDKEVQPGESKKSQRKQKKDKNEEKLEKLEEELANVFDKHLRLQAEFDNYRKRTLKEKADLIKSGGESVLVNILPVIDDFDRALESLKNIEDENPVKQGTLLIYNKFKEFLKQNNVTEIIAVNQEFNCDLHEALTKIPAGTDEMKGKNVDVVQKGYMLNDKVIRFAKVVVGE